MTEIKNFIASYPDIDDEDLIVNLSYLKEFAELQLDVDEKQPIKAGVPMKHQELQARYFSLYTPYRKGLIWHGLGTGKTFTASLIIERFKHSLVNGKPRRPALVLVRNAALRDHLSKEIAYVATSELYVPKLKKTDVQKLKGEGIVLISEQSKLRRLNEAIAKTYEILTYGELLDKKKFPSDDEIIREYSNRVIVIDEIQNIRMQSGGQISEKPEIKRKDKKEEKNLRYKNLHHFLHLIEDNSTVLLLTGTPIWDKVYDIASIFNLLSPLTNQLPTLNKFIKEYFNADNTLKKGKKNELIEMFRGKVTYVRPFVASAKRIEWGVKRPWLKYVTVYPSAMSKFQEHYAKEARKKIKDEDTPDTLYTKERDAVNCIYPIFNEKGELEQNKEGNIKVKYGTKAFKKITERTTMKVTKIKNPRTGVVEEQKIPIISAYDFPSEKRKWYRAAFGPTDGDDPYKNLRKYSAKFASFIKIFTDPNHLKEKAFYYTDSVKGTGGALSIALILQFWGGTWLKSVSDNPPKQSEVTTKNPGAFVVITSDDHTINEPAEIRRTLSVWNSDDNIYGNHIRLIIGSETISAGYTLKATRQVHIGQGNWNLSSIEQPLGRVFRLGSFNQLPIEEQYLNIYRHVAVYSIEIDETDPEDIKTEYVANANLDSGEESVKNKTWVKLLPSQGQTYLGNNIYSTEETIDTYIYQVAEEKEYRNAQIYRLMKISSWDCALTYKRNVLINDLDYSRECDFMKCNYVCNNYPLTKIDKDNGPLFLTEEQGSVWEYNINDDIDTSIVTSNYNLLYSSNDVRSYTTQLNELFKNYFTLRYDQIVSLLNIEEKNEPILLRSLDYIISQRLLIRNRYGFESYLKESNDTYFLDNKVTTFSDYLSAFYTLFPLITEKTSLEDLTEIIQLNNDEKLVKDFTKNPSLELFNKLSYRTKIILLEKAVELRYTKDEHFRDKPDEVKKVVSVVLSALEHELYHMSDGNYVHIMYNNEYTGASYNIIAQTLEANGKMRVFDINNSVGWEYIRDYNTNLEKEYLDEIRGSIKQEEIDNIEENNPYKLYGSIDKTGKFKIHDGRQGKIKSGSICASAGWTLPKLYDIFYTLNHLPYNDEITKKVKDMNSKEIIKELEKIKDFKESKFSKEISKELLGGPGINKEERKKLEKIYTLFLMSKLQLCNSIERFMKGENPEKQVYLR